MTHLITLTPSHWEIIQFTCIKQHLVVYIFTNIPTLRILKSNSYPWHAFRKLWIQKRKNIQNLIDKLICIHITISNHYMFYIMQMYIISVPLLVPPMRGWKVHFFHNFEVKLKRLLKNLKTKSVQYIIFQISKYKLVVK